MPPTDFPIPLIVLILVFVVYLGTAIKVVPTHRRVIVHRLGRPLGRKGPGLVFLMPFVDKAEWIDLPGPTVH